MVLEQSQVIRSLGGPEDPELPHRQEARYGRLSTSKLYSGFAACSRSARIADITSQRVRGRPAVVPSQKHFNSTLHNIEKILRLPSISTVSIGQMRLRYLAWLHQDSQRMPLTASRRAVFVGTPRSSHLPWKVFRACPLHFRPLFSDGIALHWIFAAKLTFFFGLRGSRTGIVGVAQADVAGSSPAGGEPAGCCSRPRLPRQRLGL